MFFNKTILVAHEFSLNMQISCIGVACLLVLLDIIEMQSQVIDFLSVLQTPISMTDLML